MSLRDLFREIEDHRFSARVNLASGRQAFIKALASDPLVRGLIAECANEASARDTLFRAIGIVRQRVDPRYENPFDAALAAYLWTLSRTYPPFAFMAAASAIEAPRCWWAALVAETIVCHKNEHPEAGLSEDEVRAPIRTSTVTLSTETGETILILDYATRFTCNAQNILLGDVSVATDAGGAEPGSWIVPPFLLATSAEHTANA